MVESAIEQLNRILGGNESHDARLQRLVRLFIGFAAESTRLLDIFIQTAGETGDADSALIIMQALQNLTQFIQSAVREGAWHEFDPTFFLFAVWGMCKFVAEPPVLPIQMFAHLAPDQLQDAQATMLVDLLINGVKAR